MEGKSQRAGTCQCVAGAGVVRAFSSRLVFRTDVSDEQTGKAHTRSRVPWGVAQWWALVRISIDRRTLSWSRMGDCAQRCGLLGRGAWDGGVGPDDGMKRWRCSVRVAMDGQTRQYGSEHAQTWPGPCLHGMPRRGQRACFVDLHSQAFLSWRVWETRDSPPRHGGTCKETDEFRAHEGDELCCGVVSNSGVRRLPCWTTARCGLVGPVAAANLYLRTIALGAPGGLAGWGGAIQAPSRGPPSPRHP